MTLQVISQIVLLIFNEKYKVDTWKEMLLAVLKLLAQKHGDEFPTRALAVKATKRAYIAILPDELVTPIKIEGTDLWVETNQSSRSVLQLINQTMELFGHDDDDFIASW